MPTLTNYEQKNWNNIDALAYNIQLLYAQYAPKLLKLGLSVADITSGKPFTFDSLKPAIKRQVNALLSEFEGKLQNMIEESITTAWDLAVDKNDNIIKSLGGGTTDGYQQRNQQALDAFLERKEIGLSLSDRVWLYTDQFKNEIETVIDNGITTGSSAQQIGTDLKQYLREPDRVYRRVRGEDGKFRLSKNAKEYHPGQGVYRSSAKNALRTARTETNMAYRNSDWMRMQQNSMIVGFEVHLSNNPNHCPTCEALAGKYPKWFKFSSWHPQCRCYVTTILKTDEEMRNDRRRKLQGLPPIQGSANEVIDVPSGFKNWIQENAERSQGWKNQPYFIRDNFEGGVISGGLVK